MEIFVSWSGNRSKAVATCLKRWIPDVIQQVEPWVSHLDINAGLRWNDEIQKRLSEIKFGIICLTGSNLTSPWVLFEAGALAKTLNNTFVCPYLIDIESTNIPAGPLAQFQAKNANKEGTWDLIKSINSAIKDSGLSDEKLKRSFERWWPELEKALTSLPSDDEEHLERTSDDKLEEVLAIVRELRRSSIKPIFITEDVAKEINKIYSLHDLNDLSKINQYCQPFGRTYKHLLDDDEDPDSK
jgi:TIR domain-containing protein